MASPCHSRFLWWNSEPFCSEAREGRPMLPKKTKQRRKKTG
jgi:hypothetical protein